MQEIDTLVFIIGCIAILAVLYGPWQEYWIEWARQKMFDAREELFNAAGDGLFSYKDRRYRDVRSEIESFIRFAHKISIARLLVYRFVLKDQFHVNSKGLAFSGIEDGPQKQAVFKVTRCVLRAILVMMVMRNPLLWGPVCLLVLFVIVAHQQRRAKEYVLCAGRAMLEYIRDAARAENAVPHLRIFSLVR
ncbi:MAG: hypothetical protein H7Z12_13740 [Rhodospirillaceae bacterium]|nr:hypothetical protein [Rhodospirillales bacterium]